MILCILSNKGGAVVIMAILSSVHVQYLRPDKVANMLYPNCMLDLHSKVWNHQAQGCGILVAQYINI